MELFVCCHLFCTCACVILVQRQNHYLSGCPELLNGVGCFPSSAYEVKNNCSLLERLFKVKKRGVFLFGISIFVLEIFAFLYYANEESDDVNRSTKTIKY